MRNLICFRILKNQSVLIGKKSQSSKSFFVLLFRLKKINIFFWNKVLASLNPEKKLRVALATGPHQTLQWDIVHSHRRQNSLESNHPSLAEPKRKTGTGPNIRKLVTTKDDNAKHYTQNPILKKEKTLIFFCMMVQSKDKFTHALINWITYIKTSTYKCSFIYLNAHSYT